jgi:hypothetical protein
MDENMEEVEQVIYEQPVKLVLTPGPNASPWQQPLLISVPEELQQGTKLMVTLTCPVAVKVQLFRRLPSGAPGEMVCNPPESPNLAFEYPVDATGYFQLKISQHWLNPMVDAQMRLAIKVPKPKEDADRPDVEA